MPRKTDEDFKNEVHNLVGDEYTFLDKYVNAKTKLKVKHNTCGSTYEVAPDRFLIGRRCPYCYGNLKKTTEQFKSEVYNLVGDKYSVLGEYRGANKKVLIKHNVCNNTYEVTPSAFLRGKRCPQCFGNTKKTTKQFKQEVYDLVGDEYSVLSEYKNNHTKIKIEHNKCGNTYEVRPNDFLRGKRCPCCYGNHKKTTEQFKQEVYDLVGDEYTVLSEYKNVRTKLKIKHNKCGYEYEVIPSNFLQGNRCYKCSIKNTTKKQTKTNKQFKSEVYNLVGDGYSVLGNYINNRTKILMKHNKCGNTYKVKPSAFLQGNRCPYCYQTGVSYGNETIAKYLDERNINYEREYRFKECVYERPLPFDFYLPNYHVAIEYDGKQHYSPNEFFEKHDPFKERQLKDRIKSKYCYQNNIKLIRIPYTQFNQIEDILDKELKVK